MMMRVRLLTVLVNMLAILVACSPADRPNPAVAPTPPLPPPVSGSGQGYSAPANATRPPLPTQPPAAAAAAAPIEGRLLIATTRTSSRPRSDLAPDYRLAWWDARGLQPISLPHEDRGVTDAAVRPGGGGIAAIIGGVDLVRANDSGDAPTDLLPHLGGAQPNNVQEYLSLAWAGPDRLLLRQTAPAGMSLLDLTQQSQSPTPLTGLDPAVSRDGQHLALGYANGNEYFSIHVADAPFTEARKLTTDAVVESGPAWSSDGSWLAYVAQVQTNGTAAADSVVRVVRSNGTDEETVVPSETGVSYSKLRWSPDGQRIAVTRQDRAAHTRRIGIVNRDGTGKVLLGDDAANDRLLDWVP